MALLAALDRINRAHPWSHNDAFIGFVMRHARAVRRSGGHTALDVGCGTGNLVERLARVLPDVVGIDPDERVASAARARFEEHPGVTIEHRRFGDEGDARYDLVVFVASLHHVETAFALHNAKRALRRGGRIVIVGVARETPSDAARSWLSLLLNPVVGLIKHPARAVRPLPAMEAPTREPTESFDEIRAVASELLPGARMRRRLFWRYTAVWTRSGG